MTIKYCLVLLLCAGLSGCGWFERKVTANITGHAVACVDGIRYLQFPSGVTLQVDANGKPRTC